MRKFVILALAAVFVVAMATYTLATEFKFGGSYRIQGIYWQDGISDSPGTYAAGFPTTRGIGDVNYYTNRLRLDMTAKVTDKLSFTCQADSGLGYGGDYRYNHPLATQDSYNGIWGNAYGAERFEDTCEMGTAAPTYESHDIVFQRAYLKYESSIGTLKAGRQWAHWGSGILESMNRNRIEFIVERPTWFMGLGVDKMEEGQITIDQDDENLYFACMGYTGENFQIGQRFEWVTENEPDSTAAAHENDIDDTVDDVNLYASSLYWKMKMGNLAFNGEYCYQWGKTGNWNVPVTSSEDRRAHGVTADVSYNFDAAKAGTQFGYFTGDGDPNDAEDNFYITPYNFSPFILVGEVPINGMTLTGRRINQTRSYHDTGWNGNYLANLWFLKGYAECAPTKNLSLTGAVGYARANQAINRPEDGARSNGEGIGTELDITGTYKFVDNLSYTAAFGYLWAGGFYDSAEGTLGVCQKANNSFVLLHQIAITF